MSNGKHPGGRPRKELSGGIHVRTVQARLRDGTLNGKKLSGVWRIYKDSLKA